MHRHGDPGRTTSMSDDSVVITDVNQLRIEPGESRRVWLGIGASWFGSFRVPLYVAKGPRPGAKLVVLVCQHGDEVYGDRKSTRLNSSHSQISYAVFCLKKKKKIQYTMSSITTKAATSRTRNTIVKSSAREHCALFATPAIRLGRTQTVVFASCRGER